MTAKARTAVHPEPGVRLALVLDVFDILDRRYRRGRRSTPATLRALNVLVRTHQGGAR